MAHLGDATAAGGGGDGGEHRSGRRCRSAGALSGGIARGFVRGLEMAPAREETAISNVWMILEKQQLSGMAHMSELPEMDSHVSLLDKL
jgi:hypothetical protein